MLLAWYQTLFFVGKRGPDREISAEQRSRSCHKTYWLGSVVPPVVARRSLGQGRAQPKARGRGHRKPAAAPSTALAYQHARRYASCAWGLCYDQRILRATLCDAVRLRGRDRSLRQCHRAEGRHRGGHQAQAGRPHEYRHRLPSVGRGWVLRYRGPDEALCQLDIENRMGQVRNSIAHI